jgi:AcrR family transcriptional regulator
VITHSFYENERNKKMDEIDFSSLNLSEKEQKILNSAIKIFNEKGFSAATTNEIAKNAGIAEGTIFRYYKTKKDILRGIIVQLINIMSDKVVLGSVQRIMENSQSKELRVVLKDILIDRLNLVMKFFPMFRIVVSEALFHEDIREALYKNVIKKGEGLFRQFYDSMIKSGQIRTDIGFDIIVRNIVGNFIVFIGQRMLFAEMCNKDDMDKEMDAVVAIIIDGIAAKK